MKAKGIPVKQESWGESGIKAATASRMDYKHRRQNW